MKIEGKGPTPAERLNAVTARDGSETAPRQDAAGRRSDSVEISAAGRARSEGSPTTESVEVKPIPADQSDRLEAVRERVRAGFYETDAVQVAVARQIVARGDHHS